MVALGAQGQTYCELHKALSLHGNRYQVANQYKQLLSPLTKNTSVMKIVNKLYIQVESKPKQEFSELLTTYFHTNATSLDFAQTETAADIINKDVARATNNKIQEIIPANLLSASTQVVLVNAVYFHSEWQHKFPSELTKARPFFTTDGNSRNIPMMRQTVKD